MQQKYLENTQASVKSTSTEKLSKIKKSAENRVNSAKQYDIERNYLKKVRLESVIAEEINRRMEQK